jgi:hypothetical protein
MKRVCRSLRRHSRSYARHTALSAHPIFTGKDRGGDGKDNLDAGSGNDILLGGDNDDEIKGKQHDELVMDLTVVG